ncbi:hypothetical protein Q8A73_009027 [Channa argus]|nr:hypothetical protein Q8A73_009027 [Channa argus]
MELEMGVAVRGGERADRVLTCLRGRAFLVGMGQQGETWDVVVMSRNTGPLSVQCVENRSTWRSREHKRRQLTTGDKRIPLKTGLLLLASGSAGELTARSIVATKNMTAVKPTERIEREAKEGGARNKRQKPHKVQAATKTEEGWRGGEVGVYRRGEDRKRGKEGISLMFLAADQLGSQGYPGFANSHGKGGVLRAEGGADEGLRWKRGGSDGWPFSPGGRPMLWGIVILGPSRLISLALAKAGLLIYSQRPPREEGGRIHAPVIQMSPFSLGTTVSTCQNMVVTPHLHEWPSPPPAPLPAVFPVRSSLRHANQRPRPTHWSSPQPLALHRCWETSEKRSGSDGGKQERDGGVTWMDGSWGCCEQEGDGAKESETPKGSVNIFVSEVPAKTDPSACVCEAYSCSRHLSLCVRGGKRCVRLYLESLQTPSSPLPSPHSVLSAWRICQFSFSLFVPALILLSKPWLASLTAAEHRSYSTPTNSTHSVPRWDDAHPQTHTHSTPARQLAAPKSVMTGSAIIQRFL